MHLLFSASQPSAAADVSDAALSDLYRHPLPRAGRPVWLRSNFVSSLDGSTQAEDGRSGGLGTPSDRHVFALHRAHADVILVGAGTVRAEGYRGVDLAPWQRELRASEGLRDFPLLAVVSRSLDLDPAIAGNRDREVGPVLVLTTPGQSERRVRRLLDSGVQVVELGDDGGVDLVDVTSRLAERGEHRVLCEGGAGLHHALLAADLVDEMSLTLAPVVVGGVGPRTTRGEPLPPREFALTSALLAEDGAVFLRYDRHR